MSKSFDIDTFASMNSDKGIPPKNYGIQVGHMTRWVSGSVRAQERLQTLRFDPIGALVSQYARIEFEIARQEAMRDGHVVELTASGKPRAYRAELHLSLYDKLTKIGESLIKYGYSKMPETQVVEHTTPRALVVQLSDDEDDQHVINGAKDDSVGKE